MPKKADVSVGTPEDEKKSGIEKSEEKEKAKIVIPVLIVVMLAICFVGIFGLHILDKNKKLKKQILHSQVQQ